jgi:Serine protease Clip domain PPAF-2
MTSKVFCLLLLVDVIVGIPQVNLNDRIQTVFGTAVVNRGFGDIVEPENSNEVVIPQTQRPTTLITTNGQPCNCVPYHKCQPDKTPSRTSDNRFFGEIDIRFDFAIFLKMTVHIQSQSFNFISTYLIDIMKKHVVMF